jgi:hypothetical protein
MKRWEESLEDANECVKINPTWPRGAECQGTALEGLGRLQEALAAFGTALRLEPGNEVRLCSRSAAAFRKLYADLVSDCSCDRPSSKPCVIYDKV